MRVSLLSRKRTTLQSLPVYAVLTRLYFPDSQRETFIIPDAGQTLIQFDSNVYNKMFRLGFTNIVGGLQSYSTLTAAHHAGEYRASCINPSRFCTKSVVVVRATIPAGSMMYTPAIRFESFLNGKHPEIKSNILEYNDVRYHVFKY